MEIKIITEGYLNDCMTIINLAKESLKNQSGQWQNGYPNETIISEDIQTQRLYGGFLEEKLIGIMALIPGVEKDYLKMVSGSWKNKTSSKDLVIHRMAVLEGYHKKGIGKMMLQYAISYAEEHHYNSVKIDTHRKNIAMQKVIDECGFNYAGVILLSREKVDPLRNAYEYSLI